VPIPGELPPPTREAQASGRQPPKHLYHYTGVDVVLKIAQSPRFFASHMSFMNDASEGRFLTTKVANGLSTIEVLLEPLRDPQLQRHWQHLVDSVRHRRPRAFVACFSANRDDLTQWRAYGGSQPIALCFPTTELLDAAGDDWELVQCIYDPIDPVAVHDWLLGAVSQVGLGKLDVSAPNAAERAEEVFGLLRRLIDAALDRYSPMYKHPAFKSEHEWRLVRRMRPDDREHTIPIQHRIANRGVVPYLEMVLPSRKDGNVLQLASLDVGPGVNQQLTVDGLRSLFHSLSVYPSQVQMSGTPYRS
jgi:hypothetical protein